MASIVLTNAKVSINAVDLSDHVRSVKINYKAEVPENTAMGSTTKTRLPGLKDWDVEVEFNQDWAAANVDATLFPLVGAAAFAVSILPVNAAASSTNPNYNGNALLESYPPMGQKVGDVAITTITLRGTGTLTRSAP
jgi:hypothetical protein